MRTLRCRSKLIESFLFRHLIGLLSFWWLCGMSLSVANNNKNIESSSNGLVRISQKNITAYNNRNLTILCYADLSNKTQSNDRRLTFTTNARMVLTFMLRPRDKKPLHQMQSFLHCLDPARTNCLAEFNFDVSCLEDQMDRNYIIRERYQIEAACQVDDVEICSGRWMTQHPFDCYDLADVWITKAPKLGEKCLFVSDNRTLECGYNQECFTKYGICLCKKTYKAENKQCVLMEPNDELNLIQQQSDPSPNFNESISSFAPDDDEEEDEDFFDKNLKLSKGTLRALVIFLLIIAILLCIALAIVIIWSRHYRRLLKDNTTTS